MNKDKRMEVWRKYNNRCAYCGEFIFYKESVIEYLKLEIEDKL